MKVVSGIRGYLREMSSVFRRGRKVAIFIDGPNMLRKELNVELKYLKDYLCELGQLNISKVYLNEKATEKLMEALNNEGFTPVVVSGNVNIRLTIDAMDAIYNPNIDVVVLGSRSAEFTHILTRAKESGKETVVIGCEPGFSISLQKSADYVIDTANIAEEIKKLEEESKNKKKKKKSKKPKKKESKNTNTEDPTTEQ